MSVSRLSAPRLLVVAWILLPCALFAQFRDVLQGTVKDASGAVIGGASVKLTNSETQRKQSTISSGEGFYHFAGLAPGTYDVESSAKGMNTAVVNRINLPAEATTAIDIVLQPGVV